MYYYIINEEEEANFTFFNKESLAKKEMTRMAVSHSEETISLLLRDIRDSEGRKEELPIQKMRNSIIEIERSLGQLEDNQNYIINKKKEGLCTIECEEEIDTITYALIRETKAGLSLYTKKDMIYRFGYDFYITLLSWYIEDNGGYTFQNNELKKMMLIYGDRMAGLIEENESLTKSI